MKNLRDNTMMKLEAIYDSRKSFYGKAWIQFWEDKVVLYSYGTVVSMFDLDTGIIDSLGTYSQTTTRHQKEFANQMREQQQLAINNNETLRTRMSNFFGIV